MARAPDGERAQPRPSDRGLRFRRGRAHGAARVPRLAARGGLRLPRGRRAVSLWRSYGGRAPRARRAGHPFPARARGEAARDRLQLGRVRRPGDREEDRRGVRGGGGRRDRSRGRDRRGADPIRQRRRAGDACDGAERLVPAGPRQPASRADSHGDRGPRPCRGDPARLPVLRQRRRDGALLLRAVEEGGGRHRDPRLHPLPAGEADAAADSRARRAAGHRGACDCRDGSASARPGGAVEDGQGRGGVSLPLHGGSRVVSRARHALPPDAARRGRARGPAVSPLAVTAENIPFIPWGLLMIVVALYLVAVAVLIAAGRREDARALAGFIPDCLVLVSRLARDERISRPRRAALFLVLGYLALPIDLVPDFLPGIGQLDDAVVLGLALRIVVRGGGTEMVREAWPGPEASLTIVLRAAGLETNGAATPPTTL